MAYSGSGRMNPERWHILIRGQVQGVGFRPHVYCVAQKLGLTGWVQNNSSGVLLEVQGIQASFFLNELTASLPPLAKVKQIESKPVCIIKDEKTFQIIESTDNLGKSLIAPDTSPCALCLQELFDSKSRYYRYPFLNCTHCGPRFSLTRNLPYDRRHTAMEAFPLCVACRQDYDSPDNRRYHAQPTACKSCGPQLSVSIATMVNALRLGQIVALKGVGGYQLLCDARNEAALQKLRQAKSRAAKPFALMVLNSQSAAAYVNLSKEAKKILISQARPILLLKKKENTLPELIAPTLSHFGIMLPSSPLHYLLFNAFAGYPDGCDWLEDTQQWVLVATSANTAGNPLISEEDEAKKLLDIVDLVVSYNRKIFAREDDSVIRFSAKAPLFIRRARGYVPESMPLPFSIPATLALGSHLKNTFCITRDDEAFISQHIGSLTNRQTIEFFHESLTHWIKFLGVKIERIAYDLHPDFYTSQLVNEYQLPALAIQHHHAHLVSVLVEHHITEPALGLALDGYGYGLDGSAWGGELLFLKDNSFKRLGHFLPIPQPGGEMAIREPWRMGASILHCLQNWEEIPKRFANHSQASLVAQFLQKSRQLPLTSSCGRLFDAASALLNLNTISLYEGQAAMQLESLVTVPEIVNGWSLDGNNFSLLPLFRHLLTLDSISGANCFHGTLIAGLAEWLLSWSKKIAIKVIVLSGGCFINEVLADGLTKQLEQNGLHVYLPKQLPPNDGGISLGQAWIAGNAQPKELSCV